MDFWFVEGSMAEDLDLNELERKAFRSTFQDGIWDLYIAGMMLNVALLKTMTASFRVRPFRLSM